VARITALLSDIARNGPPMGWRFTDVGKVLTLVSGLRLATG
jgi:hypothetical protein